MSAKKLTAPIREKINNLAEILYEFLPLSHSNKSAVTYKTIFKESKLERYYNEKDNKKQVLQKVWQNIYRNHPRLPQLLIRKIVPAAISYRKYKRNPLKKEEVIALSECLYSLGIDMRKELLAVEIDETLPIIQVPPKELIKRLENHSLNNAISNEPLQLFKDGHFNESVRKATEKFEAEVQIRTGETEIGKPLMSKVFKIPTPIIALNNLSTKNEIGIQEGYMYLTMGMMSAIRNVFSHGDEEARSPEECYEMLMFVNWIFNQLPKAGE